MLAMKGSRVIVTSCILMSLGGPRLVQFHRVVWSHFDKRIHLLESLISILELNVSGQAVYRYQKSMLFTLTSATTVTAS